MSNWSGWTCVAMRGLDQLCGSKMTILLCCTNIDLYAYAEFRVLEELRCAPQVVHCLGLCHYCAQGKLAVVDDVVIVAETSEGFWQALDAYSVQQLTESLA